MKSRAFRFAFVAAALAATTLVAALGSGAASSGEAQAKLPASLQKALDAVNKPVLVWQGPVSSPPMTKGKFVYAIPCAKVAEGCNRIVNGVQQAAKVVGWKFATQDPAGDPNKQGAIIQQATNQGAHVIVLVAIEPKLVATQLADARKKGVTIICVACGHENDKEYFTPTGIQADVTFGGFKQGFAMGAFLVADSAGEARVAMLRSPEFPINVSRWQGTVAALKLCKGCKPEAVKDFVVTDISTTLGPDSQALFQANPNANYGWVNFGGAATVVVPAALQPGAKKLKIVSFGGDRANIALILQGKQYAEVATGLTWMGWAAVDNANRIMNGQPRLANDNVPSKLITKQNAAKYVKEGFEGDIDFRAKYIELWKKGKTDRSAKALR